MDYKAIALKIVEAELSRANANYSDLKHAFKYLTKKQMEEKSHTGKAYAELLQEAGNRVDEVAGTYYWITQQD